MWGFPLTFYFSAIECIVTKLSERMIFIGKSSITKNTRENLWPFSMAYCEIAINSIAGFATKPSAVFFLLPAVYTTGI